MAKSLVVGIGLNDTTLGRTDCPFYHRWYRMLARCYSPQEQARHPYYIGCSVHPDWHNFSNFLDWMITQNWHGKDLDKDLLVTGNKMYGPDTCAFIDPKTNGFLSNGNAHLTSASGVFGVTVNRQTKKLKARCQNPFTGQNEHLGYFDTPTDAHEAWRKRKHELACQLAVYETDPRVQQALLSRYQ